MGNLLSICPCNSEDNSKYVKNEYDPIGGLNLGKPQYQEQISRGSADQLLDTHSSLPSNIWLASLLNARRNIPMVPCLTL